MFGRVLQAHQSTINTAFVLKLELASAMLMIVYVNTLSMMIMLIWTSPEVLDEEMSYGLLCSTLNI